MITLNNEEVYRDKDRVIHKLYCPKSGLYGLCLQSKDGRKDLHPAYKYIHSYFSDGKAVVITPEGQHLWVDENLNLSQMSVSDETIMSTLHLANSNCNCFGISETETATCSLCRNGIIRNTDNFRRIPHTDILTYEYETAIGSYRITLHEELSISMRHDYWCRICDLEDELQDLIDEQEKRDKTGNDRSVQICVIEDLGENVDSRIFLRSYRTEIEVLEMNVFIDFDSNYIYMDL
jgi:hypothetical protein